MKRGKKPEPRSVRLQGRKAPADELTLRRWARIHWHPGKRVRARWHPIIHDEVEAIEREHRAGEPVYHGGRHPSGHAFVTVKHPGKRAQLLRWRLELRRHSPSGLEWGYSGSGPSQLALALLADATGDEHLATDAHQAFKSEVISKLPNHGWTKTRTEILAWVRKYQEARRIDF